MTFTFEGQPRGTRQNVGTYSEAGMSFIPIAPGSLFLDGGGIPGYPDNGTCFLEIPDGFPGVGGLSFTFTQDFQLVSFQAAEYDSAGPQTLTVIGYRDDIMGLRVTNTFTVNSLTFQTFYLDASFINVGRVDVLNARWSLDNLVISVPEPTTGSLALLGAAGAVAWSRFRRKQRSRKFALLNTPFVAKPPGGN